MPHHDTQSKVKQNIHVRAKHAIALAMRNSWTEAVEANLAILDVTPSDLEAHNRLGKALTELGRLDKARLAFQKALELAPLNPIATKNLDRLMHMGDQIPTSQSSGNTSPHAFIEDSGKTGVTSLTSLAPAKVLLKMRPGQHVVLTINGTVLKVFNSLKEHVGNIEPKLASRLIRLIQGGNRYEATVTSVSGSEMAVIVSEVFRNPSQSEVVSFFSRFSPSQSTNVTNPSLSYNQSDDGTAETNRAMVKDWSDDDTEPGDDDAFSPAVHRIINPGEDAESKEEY